ncbi:MAG: HAD family hydrolase [archaeon]|nr:HAD family hydrolase [archaeon]
MVQQINLKEIDLVIFDNDGVILDLYDAINRATIESREKYPQIHGENEDILGELSQVIEKLQKFPIPRMILNAKELFDVSFLDPKEVSLLKTLEIAISIYTKFNTYKKEAKIYDGIDKLIKFLSGKGKKLAILTNQTKRHAEEALEKYDLKKYFVEVMGVNEAPKTKPDPDGILKLCEKYGIKKTRTVFIGDMVTDIQAGLSAGIKSTISVASGLAKKEKLMDQKPNIIVNNTTELSQVFGLKI